MALNLNTDLALINTGTNSGTITLPLATSIPGRVLTFKDIQGTFGTNSLTLICSGSDTFEDGGIQKILSESYGSIQIVASGTKWYILNGTQVNTLQVSTLFTTAISSFNISTLNTTISTLSFIDNFQSTTLLNISSCFASTQNISTNLLYYNNYVIAGTRIGYSNVLNNSSYSPLQTPGLAFWFDASDPNSVRTSGSNVIQWLDKSLNKNNSISLTTNFPLVSTVGQVSLSTIRFNGTNTRFTIPLTPSFDVLYQPYLFAIVCKPNYSVNLTGINGIVGYSNTFGTSLDLFTRGFTTSVAFYTTIPDGNGMGSIPSTSTQLVIYQKTLQTATSLYQNGLFQQTVNSSRLLAGGAPFVLGWVNTAGLGNNFYSGELCELLFHNALTTNSHRQSLEGYLAWKWGIQGSLPASHPYKNAPP